MSAAVEDREAPVDVGAFDLGEASGRSAALWMDQIACPVMLLLPTDSDPAPGLVVADSMMSQQTFGPLPHGIGARLDH